MIARARVSKGHLVIDEPTTLPEGAEIALERVDDDDAWALSAEDLAELRDRIAAADRGEVIEAGVVLDRLHAGR